MILLILENELLGIQVEVFKFHYDSINSMRPLIFLAMSANLNSIMILLIQICASYNHSVVFI